MATSTSVPPVSAWFQNGFHAYLRRLLRRHFHTVAIDRQSRCESVIGETAPLIVYANHPSWWDPLIAHFLNRTLFPSRQFYAPIDADALEKYRVFAKLGFYGVKMNTTSGAAAFLKQSSAILAAAGTSIWMTPEGRFADARDHAGALMPGLAHLCHRMSEGWVLPLTLEYVFWEERLPECLSLLGTPINIAEHHDLSKPEWSELLTERLREAQTRLSERAIQRSAEPFDSLMSGTRGAGGAYDSFRRAKAWATGQDFRASHGEHFE